MAMGGALGFALILGGVLLLAALAYLAWALPRLDTPVAAFATAVLAMGCLFAAALSRMPIALAWAVGAAALAMGHAGFVLGRRPPPTPRSAPTPTLARAPAPPPLLQPAAPDRKMLGRYRIERELGRGAMGAVYLGQDPKIGRQVAIKTMALSQEFEGDELVEARQRFFREAETAGRLQHRDIVTIFDAGEDQGLAYIAMEFLKGQDLQACTQPGRLLPVATVVRVAARVAEALAYAHSHGVVHRDIKPANVMVDPTTEAVKVTDFGIARIGDASRTRTRTGLVMGTPSFMSPEQMSGARVDGRTDLYSLGVMLFQLLTGRLPHRSDSMATLMHQIANEPAADVRTLRPDLPEALARIVARALEKRPDARYGDGHQMALDLRAVLPQLGDDVKGPDPAVLSTPPDSDEFQATVKMIREVPGHNSGL